MYLYTVKRYSITLLTYPAARVKTIAIAPKTGNDFLRPDFGKLKGKARAAHKGRKPQTAGKLLFRHGGCGLPAGGGKGCTLPVVTAGENGSPQEDADKSRQGTQRDGSIVCCACPFLFRTAQ